MAKIDKQKLPDSIEDSIIALAADPFKELDFDIDTKHRLIYLRDDITILTPTFIRKRINLLCSLLDDYKTPITLEVSSYGGDVYGMLGTVDVIKTAPMKINVIGIGCVMSAASFILASGTGIRALTKNSYIMIHDINGWIKGNHSDIITETAQLKKLQSLCYDIYAQNTNQKSKYWESLVKSNIYINTAQAKKYGMIDEVLKTWNLKIKTKQPKKKAKSSKTSKTRT